MGVTQGSRQFVLSSLLAFVAFAALALVASPAKAAITPTSSADALTGAAVAPGTAGAVTASSMVVTPPNGNPTATADSDLALFPLNGDDYAILSTGDATAADDPDNAEDTSTSNGGDGDGHGSAVNDLVTLRIDFDVPEASNCLTADFRFLTEEFPEFIGSDFNDAFLIEVGETNFQVADDGAVDAENNIAVGPDGRLVTVNTTGTSAQNALETTYDGATPVMRASTPIESGPQTVFISIYDAGDAIYDSTAFVDNIRLRTADQSKCSRGSAPNDDQTDTCLDKTPTIFAVNGKAVGTEGDDVIQGSDADDVIRGKGGNDLICGGPGDDLLVGGADDDRIVGNTGDDEIKGNGGNDRLDGKRGNDEVSGQNGGDQVKGGDDEDRLFGGGGDDFLFGGRASDFLQGRAGDDTLNGGKGRDTLRGGKGNDTCKGKKGEDDAKGCS